MLGLGPSCNFATSMETAMAAHRQDILLQQLEQQVEQHLQHAISRFQNLDAQMLNRPSSTGGWSVAQCLWHLNSYGNFYHPHVAKALVKAKSRPVDGLYRESWLGGKFARMMDPTTGKGKMKAFKSHVPPQMLDGQAIVAEFIRQQDTLLVHVRAARGRDLRSVSIPVSIMPWLKLPLGDVLRFLIAHDRRHVEQALRNLPQAG